MTQCFIRPDLAAHARPKGAGGPPETGYYIAKISAKSYQGDRMLLNITLPGGFVRKNKAVWLPAKADGTPLPGLADWQLADRVNDVYTAVVAQSHITEDNISQMKTDGFSDDWVQVGSSVGVEWQTKESMGDDRYGEVFLHPHAFVTERIEAGDKPSPRGAPKTTAASAGSMGAPRAPGAAPTPPPARGAAPVPPAAATRPTPPAPPAPANRPGAAPAPPPPPGRA